jgi:hypothetical protein
MVSGLKKKNKTLLRERKVFKMKKIIYITMTMVFGLALGLTYAEDNGVTDFTGKSYDMFEIGPAADISHVEGSAAGGLRAGETIEKLHNGVTDFTGKSYDTFEISQAPSDSNVAEGSAAGGLRQNWAGEKTSVTSYEELNLNF